MILALAKLVAQTPRMAWVPHGENPMHEQKLGLGFLVRVQRHRPNTLEPKFEFLTIFCQCKGAVTTPLCPRV